jgi:hypothetical protein
MQDVAQHIHESALFQLEDMLSRMAEVRAEKVDLELVGNLGTKTMPSDILLLKISRLVSIFASSLSCWHLLLISHSMALKQNSSPASGPPSPHRGCRRSQVFLGVCRPSPTRVRARGLFCYWQSTDRRSRKDEAISLAQ